MLTLGGPRFTAIDFGGLGAYWPGGDLSSTLMRVSDLDAAVLRPVLLGAHGAYDEDALREWDAVWTAFAMVATPPPPL